MRRGAGVAAALLLAAAGCGRPAVPGTRIPERVVDRMRHAGSVHVLRLGDVVPDGQAAGREIFGRWEVTARAQPGGDWRRRFVDHVLATAQTPSGAPGDTGSTQHTMYGVRFVWRGHIEEVAVDLATLVLEIRDDGRVVTRRTLEPAEASPAVSGSFAALAREAFPADPAFAPADSTPPPYGRAVAVDQMPVATAAVRAFYPPAAERAHAEGVVVVAARVCADGHVDSTVVVRSIPLLDASAVEAVRRSRFVPATRSGRAVATWTTVPVRFALPHAR